MPRILILDGNSLANRAFYALPFLTTGDGRPTNVLHGFMTMLFRLAQEQKPDYWVVAFDKTKATVRIEQYANYKAQRKETPEGLRPQFDYLKDVLAGFEVPMLELAGYEADDLIATVVTRAESRGWEIQIYTGDRDALQLISPKTEVFLTKKGISEVEPYDEQALWDKYKLRPYQIIDLKGLMGDASDNIPGVPGIGEKTALKLLWEFGTVEEVLTHRQKVSGQKLQNSLEEYADQAILSKNLATMLKDVPLEFSIDDLHFRQPSRAKALEVLHKYELRNVARLYEEKYLSEQTVEPRGGLSSEEDNTLVEWPEKVLNHSQWLEKIREWESGNFNLYLAYRYLGANPHWAEWSEWACAIDGQSYHLKKENTPTDVLEAWFRLLENPLVGKVVVDYKSLVSLLAHSGKVMKGLKFDLSLGAYLLNPARTKFAPLDIVRDHFPSAGPFINLTEEASSLAQITSKMENELENHGLTALLHDLEEPLSPVLAQMERTGIGIDTLQLDTFGEELKAALIKLEQDIYQMAGEHFNINSTQQLGAVLFEKLGLPPVKKTKTGYSTDAETLEELRSAHEIIDKILDYRQLNKLMSTYVNGLSAQVRDGIVHTTFQQTVTATGRLSSTEPNLQNIPIRLEYGRRLRKVFQAVEPGWHLLSADYSQIELRVLAHYSQDPLLCESFALGQDVHTRTAAEVFGVRLEEVTSDLRRKAKAVNFGLIYGLTDFGLARDLGIPRREAKHYIDQYFARYHGVKEYLEGVVAKAKQEGQVRTLLNRLRKITELHHPNRVQRQFGERIAMNTPVQGTAADIMKLAMLGVAERIREYRAEMLLQVHDELLLQVAPEELNLVSKVLKEEMESAFPLSVPLTVECKAGPNWYEMQPIEIV